MDQLVAAVMRRVNPGGQREVTVRQYGENQIEVIIPQAEQAELERIKRIISQTGSLEFRILCNERDHPHIIELADKNPQAREILDSQGNRLAWWVPVEKGQEHDFAGRGWQTVESGKGDGEIRWRTRTDQTGNKTLEVLVFQDVYHVKGDYLVDVRPGFDRRGRPCVEFTFNSTGAQLFGRLTGDNVPDETSGFRRRLGIILNGSLYSAPNIESTIYDRGEITGNFTRHDVEDLVRVLKAGQLPAALTERPISELVTGPTLGEDLIRRGTIATILSILFVFGFMAIYYRVAGLVASTAMLMNLAMVLALMIMINAELTLSGFAGLVLGVGMAVDANVLIYERMREELEREATLRMAIRNGFHRAMSAIIDSNLTTLITAAVLYVVGTDQIKGFAITLLLGVLLSLYTGVFCSRVAFDVMERQGWISRLRMLKMLGRTNIDFLGVKYIAVGISGALILIGLIGAWARGQGLFNIDFTGGVSVEVVFKQPQDIAEIRRVLSNSLPDLAVSDVRLLDEPKGLRFVINTSLQPPTDPQTGQGLINPKTGQPYTAVQWVEEILIKEFGDKLATNSLSIQSLEPIQAPKPGPPPAQAKPEGKPSEPAKPEPKPSEVKPEPKPAEPKPEGKLPEPKPSEPKPEPKPSETKPSEPAKPEPKPSESPKSESPKSEPKSSEGAKPEGSPSEPKPEPKLSEPAEKPPSAPPPAPSASEKKEKSTEQPGEKTSLESGEWLGVMFTGRPVMLTALSGQSSESVFPAQAVTGPGEWAVSAGEQNLLLSMAEQTAANQVGSTPARSEPAPAEKPQTSEKPLPAGKAQASEQSQQAAPSQSAEKPLPAKPPAEPAAKAPPEPAAKPSAAPAAKPTGQAKLEVFAGGTKARLKFTHPIEYDRLKTLLQEALQQLQTAGVAFELSHPEYVPGISTAFPDWEVHLALPVEEAKKLLEKVNARLQEAPYFPSSNEIGGKVAGGTRRQAVVALVASLFFIILYIWVRFQRLVYGLAAVVALIHDVAITLGAVALTYWLAPVLGFLLIDEMKIGLDVLAAFLTLIGYSLNDTIVIFDRIREVKGKTPWITQEMINRSVNDTLARTIITGGGVIMGLLILYVMGGEGIHAFAFTMLFGVVTGTFSSIYIASPILLWLAKFSGEAKPESPSG
jgi:SecD/SecF fusion protein